MEEEPQPTRLEQLVAELTDDADLINSGIPVKIEIHCFPHKLEVAVTKLRTRKF